MLTANAIRFVLAHIRPEFDAIAALLGELPTDASKDQVLATIDAMRVHLTDANAFADIAEIAAIEHMSDRS